MGILFKSPQTKQVTEREGSNVVAAPWAAPLGATASGQPLKVTVVTVTAVATAGFEPGVVLAIPGPLEVAWACLPRARVCPLCHS